MPSIKIYSKEQVDDLISGVAPPTVVQTTGSSTTDVMSQNAVTTALGNKADTSALPTSSQLVPSTTGASQGDVLTFNGTSVDWAAGGSGGMSVHTFTSLADLYNAIIANINTCIVKVNISRSGSSDKCWTTINQAYVDNNNLYLSSVLMNVDGTTAFRLLDIIFNSTSYIRARVLRTQNYSGSNVVYVITNGSYQLTLSPEDYIVIY